MKLLDRLNNDFLFFDGGMGSLLQKSGLPNGELPERWNITNSDKIVDVHLAYINAGSDIITTNTFGASPIKLNGSGLVVEDVVKAAIENVNSAIIQSGHKREDKYIALDIGPTGKLLKPLGELDFEDAVSNFKEVISSGVKFGVDLILIETMSDIYEAKAAIIAAKECCDLPIFVSVTFDEFGKLMTGADVLTVVTVLEGLRVDAIGMNCGLGPKQIKPLLSEMLKYSSTPIFIQPNAGLPRCDDCGTVYDVSEEEFSLLMAEFADMGAVVFGGCCGTTPSYINKTINLISGKEVKKISKKKYISVSSYEKTVFFGDEPILIGERINPTGKKLLKAALLENNIDYILSEAIRQQEKNVQILDVNVGLPGIDESNMMQRIIKEIQGVSSLPLQIDTTNIDTMEKAMRIYNGKPLINSVNGKKESMQSIFPLVKKYGGIVIGLTLDENGIPDTAEGRLNIAEKIYSEAEKYGISETDIIIDPLALTISTDKNSAFVTLEVIEKLTKQGRITSLGVSNISFGLPSRDVVNSTFFALALERGLSAAIMNPFSNRMMETYYSFLALHGLDNNFDKYINNVSPTVIEKTNEINDDTLENAIKNGLSEKASKLTAELLKSNDQMKIINEMIIPALDQVGKGFENKTVYLPRLLMSADAAKSSFEVIKSSMAASNRPKKGKIILATVKGDIHDIGKNIVKSLLVNYGFDVIDLGKDVHPQIIYDAVIEHQAKLICLSALMTTTVGAMEDTINLLADVDCKVMVGGAVVTADYAKNINADFYAKDAMEAVRIAEELFKN